MTAQELWQAVLGELELAVSKANFTTWLKNTFILNWEKNKIEVAVPSTFYKDYILKRYHERIKKAIQNITDYQVKEINYIVTSGKNITPIKPAFKVRALEEKETKKAVKTAPSLNPRYTFARFVVGKKNELAHAAALAVSKKPGSTYNPLFIYGGVGLGKTHLMQAIGHQIFAEDPTKKILYAPCETFTNEYVKSVSLGQAHKFHEKYRSVDVLLIDDIQFLVGKEGTQEAFFHTFNHLQQHNKQIVITSDRPPKALPAIEARLTSRFEGGMIADIGLPDLETRMAILKARCAEQNFNLNDKIINFLATNVQNNIRELEGALNSLIASAQLSSRPLTPEEAKTILRGILVTPKKKGLTAKQIINHVADYFSVKEEDLIGLCRKKELVVPRQIVMYLMREEMRASYPNIGVELGNRDHTTVMHACNKIIKCLEEDEKLRQDITLIKERIFNVG